MAEAVQSVSVTPENVADIQSKVEADRAENKPVDTFSPAPNPDEESESTEPVAEESSETPDQADEEVSEEASEEADDTPAEESPVPGVFTGDEYQTYYNEFISNGELSEQSHSDIVGKLESVGLPKELLDEYLAGQTARLSESLSQAHAIVGGEETYNGMIEWARESLSQSEADAFDVAVSNPQTATLAIKGLHADYKAAGNTTPRSMRTQGGVTQQGSAPIRSRAELSTIVGSDRYKNDPAYREDVHRRLEQSRNSGQYRIV
jgi:hypothetical protein